MNNPKGRDVKKFVTFAAAIAAMSFVGSANAADMPIKAPVVKAPIATPVSWTGFYLGGSVGYGWGRTDWTYNPIGSSPTPNPIKSHGWLGGGHVGYLHQWSNNIVLGVEGQFLGSSLKGSSTCPNPSYTCNVNSVSAMILAGGRFGVAFRQWLPYVTGGYATAKLATNDNNLGTGGTVFEGASSWNSGYYIGGGLDFMVMPNLIFGIEYDHLALQSKLHPGAIFALDARDVDLRADIVRARLSWKFNVP